MKALAKKTDDRYQTVMEFARALEQAVQQPIQQVRSPVSNQPVQPRVSEQPKQKLSKPPQQKMIVQNAMQDAFRAPAPPRARTMSKRGGNGKALVFIILSILVISAALISGLVYSRSRMQTPNKTTLYVGDNNWSGWAGSSDWMIQNTPAGTVGVLLNDGSQNMKWIAPTILAPYQVSGTADYAVDAHIDVMFNQGGIWDGCFGIGLRGSNTSDNGWQGYWATICHTGSSTDSATVYIQASSPNLHSTNLTQISFAPQYGWNYTYTYRVEVIGSSIRLFVDGSFLAQVTDTNFPTGGQIGFASYNTPLSIYDFSVEAI